MGPKKPTPTGEPRRSSRVARLPGTSTSHPEGGGSQSGGPATSSSAPVVTSNPAPMATSGSAPAVLPETTPPDIIPAPLDHSDPRDGTGIPQPPPDNCKGRAVTPENESEDSGPAEEEGFDVAAFDDEILLATRNLLNDFSNPYARLGSPSQAKGPTGPTPSGGSMTRSEREVEASIRPNRTDVPYTFEMDRLIGNVSDQLQGSELFVQQMEELWQVTRGVMQETSTSINNAYMSLAAIESKLQGNAPEEKPPAAD
ncbi:hypothetical protein FA95DRAFT_1606990 [Auriscalpium vulgare]|uniref:Uncharacterized protein n=1 Tax=Auriscalpium vulgare TaxID=40419 RepID=A0ACB8RRT7_9AGAM|nr:hypothetical protein FA95DRAFT_1606990 [Auriscalpium vulgare]